MLRWLAVIGAALIVLLGSAFAILRLRFNGDGLAGNITDVLNKRMRGRIAIGSVEWDAASLREVATGGWVPVTVRDVTVWDDCALSSEVARDPNDALRTGDPNEDCTPDDRPDPDPTSRRKPRKRLVQTPKITAEVDIHALLFGNHDVVLRNVWLHGGEALLEQADEPYPLHAYDQTIVSIVTAFYPRQRPAFRAGIYADTPPPIFDVRDIHIKGLNLTIHMTPRAAGAGRIEYATTARLENVNVDAGDTPGNDSYFYMDASDPLVAKFYVRLAVTAERGVVRARDIGPRSAFRIPDRAEQGVQYPPAGRTAEYAFGLSDIKLDRLAQLPQEWARHDFVANTLELDLHARTVPCLVPGEAAAPPSAGADLHISGQLHDYWDRPYDGAWDLALEAKNLGPTIRSCVKSTIGGDALDGTITLTGPFIALPAVGLDLQNLDVDIPLRAGEAPLALTLAEVHGKIDLVNEQGYIDKTKALIRGGKEPGEVDLSATFGLSPFNANAHVEIVKAIDVGRFLPPKVVAAAGRFLHGELSARGDITEGFALEDFDLALGANGTDRAIRVHQGTVFTGDEFKTVHVNHVMVEAGRSRAWFDGMIAPDDDKIELDIDGTFPDLDVWLKRFGLPQFVTSAGGTVIKIRGKLSAPTVNVATELGGVPCLDKVRIVDATVADGIADGRFTSAGLGGSLAGSVRIELGNQRIQKLKVEGRRLDAAKLCGLSEKVKIKGFIDRVDVAMTNTTIDTTRSAMDWLGEIDAYVGTSKLTLEGDPYQDIGICVNHADDKVCRPRAQYLDADDLAQCAAGRRGGFCIVATATRVDGGVIDATIARLPASRTGSGKTATTVPETLGGTVSLHDLPLSILETFVGAKVAGGLASVTLHLEGSPRAPQATGGIDLLRTWVEEMFVGDAHLAIEPAKLGSVAGLSIRGTALAGRLRIAGTIGTQAPYPVELSVTVRRLELDVLVDLQARLGLPVLPGPLQAWVTGTVTVKTELAPVRATAPEAWVELSELEAVYTHLGTDGETTPLRLRVLTPADRGRETAVSLRVTPTAIELACRDLKAPGGRAPCAARLGTPAGIIDISGFASTTAIAIKAGGDLDLSLVAPLVDATFATLTGRARLDASIGGTAAEPRYEVALELADVVGKPVGGDTVLQAPSGLIKLANGSLGFTDVKIQVRDEHRDEAGELHVKGAITLDGFTPSAWGVLVSGKIAGKMLLVAAPSQFSQASGLARIEGDLLLTGKSKFPEVSGTIVFAPLARCPRGRTETADGTECRPGSELPRPLSIIPRGFRRELAFTRGSIDIETEVTSGIQKFALGLTDIETTIDGEGSLTNINGRVELEDQTPSLIDVTLDARKIPFRIPGSLDVVIGATGVSIEQFGASSPPSLRGTIDVDGAYRRNFQITDRITSLGSSSPPTKPFWETYPTLGAADLRLTINVQQFAVLNNVAEIYLGGKLSIVGTPRDPRLDGSITVNRGTFRIPGTRARFERTSGSITFQPNERAGNPRLDVSSDSNYRDQSGQDHLITASITGSLDQLQWDLKTSSGYNKSQTLSLLVLGRGPEALRRSLGDQAVSNDPTRVDPTTNPSQGFADQIVKDLAGDWVSGLLGDSLSKLTGLDVFKVEVSFNSIGLHVEKNILENIKVLGDTEQTVRGNTLNARVELDTQKDLTFQTGYLSKNFNDPAEQDIVDASVSAKKTWRIFVP